MLCSIIYSFMYLLYLKKKPTETVQMILLFKFYFLKQDMNKSFVLLGVKEKRGVGKQV